MARLRDLFKNVRIRSDMEAPAGSTMTGEMHKRKPIYSETIPQFVFRQKEIGGDKIWHERNGQKVGPVMERVPDPETPFITKEFVLEDMGNGIVQKNYHFRDLSPAQPEVLTPEQEKIKELETKLAWLADQLTDEVAANLNRVEIDPDVDELGLTPDDEDVEDLGLKDG